MNLSPEILYYEMQSSVVFHNIIPDQNLQISDIRFITQNISEKYETGYAYLCRAAELPAGEAIPPGCCFLCMGQANDINAAQYQHINLLLFAFRDFSDFCNRILNIFSTYNKSWKRIEEYFSLCRQIDNHALDLIAELVGSPLCMMDANYNVFAHSIQIAPLEDKLWYYLVKGYGYHYYDIVCQSHPRLEEVAKMENGELETVNNIGGHTLRVKAIYVNGIPVAFLGMHSMSANALPFPAHMVQLFNHAVRFLQSKNTLLKHVQKSRGKAHEQFMEDLLTGKCNHMKDLQECIAVADIPRGDFYLLGVVYFETQTPMAYNHIGMMDCIENTFSTSKCIKFENYVIILTSLKQEEVFDRKIAICSSAMLKNLLNECSAKIIFSWFYENLLETPDIFGRLKEIKKAEFIKATAHTMIHSDMYYTALVMKQLEKLHIIDVLNHPDVQKLTHYDEANHTELYLTLSMYLKNNCSIATTANIMHLHRNTLQYRLRQIESLTAIDFSNARARAQLIYAIDATDYRNGLYN